MSISARKLQRAQHSIVTPPVDPPESAINPRAVPSVVLDPSAWPYRLLPNNAPVHSSYQAIVDNMIYQGETNFGSPGNPNITVEMQNFYTTLTRVDSNDPLISITRSGDSWLNTYMQGVRLYDDPLIPPGSDHNMCVWQSDTNRIYDVWKFQPVDMTVRPRQYSAGQAGSTSDASTWDGRWHGSMQGRGANAAGLTAAATAIRIHEFLGSAGTYSCGCPIIPHVIGWTLPELYGGIYDADTSTWTTRKFSFPATRTDGRNSTDPNARLWMGQYTRIPHDVDVHTIGQTRLQTTLLHTMQRYGVIATDTSGAIGFGTENLSMYTTAEQDRFRSEMLNNRMVYQEMANFPFSSFRPLAIDYIVP